MSGVNTAGRWGGTVMPSHIERFEGAYDRQVQAWGDATCRGEATGPSTWDEYAVAAISEAGVRDRTEGVRVEVELVERPASTDDLRRLLGKRPAAQGLALWRGESAGPRRSP